MNFFRISGRTEVPIRRLLPLKQANVSLLVAGPDEGPSVVCLHGLVTSAELWRPVMYHLACQGYRVYAPDLLGHGYTQSLDNDYSFKAQCNLIHSLAKELHLKKSWWVGHDLGVSLILKLANMTPMLIERITIGNPIRETLWPVSTFKLLENVGKWKLYKRFVRLKLLPNALVRRGLHNSFSNIDKLDRYTEEKIFWKDKIYNQEGQSAFMQMLRELNLEEAAVSFSSFQLLTLQIIWGREDPCQNWSRAESDIQSQCPQARIDVIDQCGHYPQIEKPEQYARSMISWVET